MKKWFDSLDDKMKAAVIIIAIIFVIYIFRTAKAYIKAFGGLADNLGEVGALKAQGMKATFTKSEYNTFANQLEREMIGINFDRSTIKNIINKMENDIDIINLENAFGLRSSWGTAYDLSEWLRGDLDSSEMLTLNTRMSQKGITKQF